MKIMYPIVIKTQIWLCFACVFWSFSYMSDSRIGRIPPRSIEAENSVIASLLLDNKSIDEVSLLLSVDDFYSEFNQIVYSAITKLRTDGNPIDLITVSEYLRDNDDDKSYNPVLLADLLDRTPTVSNVKYYANIVKKYSEQRNIINTCNEIIDTAYDKDVPLDDLLEKISIDLVKPTFTDHSFKSQKLSETIPSTLDYIEQMYHSKGEIRGVPSGLADIDRITSGFQNSDLITIAARPGNGKTTFALNIARNAASDSIGQGKNHNILFLSLEMPIRQIVLKLISMESKIEQARMKNGNLTPTDFISISNHSLKIGKYPIYINDVPSPKIGKIKAIARQQKYLHGIDCLIIDYLGMIRENENWSNRTRTEAVGNISRELKSLARELDIPVIILTQLNRKIEERSNPQPMFSDLRESGNIEQDSDMIIFLYSSPEQGDSNNGMIKCDIGKHRNGSPAYGIDLFFNKALSRFENAVNNDFKIY